MFVLFCFIKCLLQKYFRIFILFLFCFSVDILFLVYLQCYNKDFFISWFVMIHMGLNHNKKKRNHIVFYFKWNFYKIVEQQLRLIQKKKILQLFRMSNELFNNKEKRAEMCRSEISIRMTINRIFDEITLQ